MLVLKQTLYIMWFWLDQTLWPIIYQHFIIKLIFIYIGFKKNQIMAMLQCLWNLNWYRKKSSYEYKLKKNIFYKIEAKTKRKKYVATTTTVFFLFAWWNSNFDKIRTLTRKYIWVLICFSELNYMMSMSKCDIS